MRADNHPPPRPVRRLSTRVLAVLAACAWLGVTPAAAAWYQVELLLFLSLDPDATQSPSWTTDPGTPDMTGARPLQASAGGPYTLVDPRNGLLNPYRRQLDRSGRYESVLHLAWRQPISSASQAQKLSFRLPATGPDHRPGGVGEPPGDRPRLEGTIRMSRGRFVQADLDVVYREPSFRTQRASRSVAAEHATRAYRLRETRRMRSAEVNYLDHPVLGALIVVKALGSGQGSGSP